jgi:hypothetical protein
LKFSYTAKYPEEVPEVEISESENFEEEDEALLKDHIIQQVGFEYWYTFVLLQRLISYNSRGYWNMQRNIYFPSLKKMIKYNFNE